MRKKAPRGNWIGLLAALSERLRLAWATVALASAFIGLISQQTLACPLHLSQLARDSSDGEIPRILKGQQRYSTEFLLSASKKNEVLSIIERWLVSKYPQRSDKDAVSRIFSSLDQFTNDIDSPDELQFENDQQMALRLSRLELPTEAYDILAFRLTHPDSKYRQRRWVVDFSMENQGAEDLSIQIRLFTEVQEGALMPPEPQMSMPRFVGDLLELGARTESGIALEPRVFGVGHLQLAKFRDLLASASRKLPIVYLSKKQDGRYAVNPDHLAQQMHGKALVFVEEDDDLAQALSYYLSRDLLTYGGAVRVYRPFREQATEGGEIRRSEDPQGHPYFTAQAFQVDPKGTRARLQLAVNRSLTKTRNIFDVLRMRGLVQREALLKTPPKDKEVEESEEDKKNKKQIQLLKNELEALKEKLNEEQQTSAGLLAEADEEAQMKNEEITSLRSRVATLEAESKALRAEIYSLRAEGKGVPPNKDYQPSSFDTVEAALEGAANHFSDKIEVTNKAIQTARDNFPSGFQHVDKAAEIFQAIATHLWDIYFDSASKNVGRVQRQFQDLSGFGFASTETGSTRSKEDLMRHRDDTHNGKSFRAESHAKWGNKPGEQIRVHVFVDNAEQKIIISAVVDHYPTSKSKRSGNRP